MRIVLADLRASDGLVSKDTVAGGYGSRLVPFSRVTRIFCRFKKWFLESPSVQMAYLAAICAEKGHEVLWTQDRIPDADVALVLPPWLTTAGKPLGRTPPEPAGFEWALLVWPAPKSPNCFKDTPSSSSSANRKAPSASLPPDGGSPGYVLAPPSMT